MSHYTQHFTQFQMFLPEIRALQHFWTLFLKIVSLDVTYGWDFSRKDIETKQLFFRHLSAPKSFQPIHSAWQRVFSFWMLDRPVAWFGG